VLAGLQTGEYPAYTGLDAPGKLSGAEHSPRSAGWGGLVIDPQLEDCPVVPTMVSASIRPLKVASTTESGWSTSKVPKSLILVYSLVKLGVLMQLTGITVWWMVGLIALAGEKSGFASVKGASQRRDEKRLVSRRGIFPDVFIAIACYYTTLRSLSRDQLLPKTHSCR
jgi:hypothetical protein